MLFALKQLHTVVLNEGAKVCGTQNVYNYITAVSYNVISHLYLPTETHTTPGNTTTKTDTNKGGGSLTDTFIISGNNLYTVEQDILGYFHKV